jgi:KaiC/GvpD/RAD55 family RecA-like ATPase
MVMAGPGTGKSAFTQHWLQCGDRAGHTNRTLYFSSDSDAGTMHVRAAAIATGWTTESIEHLIREGDSERVDAIVADATKHMQWQYESSPDEDFICTEIEAYATLWGAYPEAMVFDNLKNIWVDESDEFRALENASVFLSGLAKETNAAIVTTHHVEGKYENGFDPIPLNGVRGKVSKTPEMVLALHRPGDGLLGIGAVKNRSGVADPSGRTFTSIPADLGRMAFGQ